MILETVLQAAITILYKLKKGLVAVRLCWMLNTETR